MRSSIALAGMLPLMLITTLPGSTKVAVAQGKPLHEMVEAVAKGDNQFAFELYHQLSKADGNLFLSPYSISTALAMTSAGARGKTLEEMATVFHLPPQDELHRAMAALIRQINGGQSKKSYQLSTANTLWGAKDCSFRPEFLKLVKDNYGGDLTSLDFAGDAEGARRTINAWVEKKTQDKIKDLIAKGILNADTRLVLTNAIYFKGNWELPFKEDSTKEEQFRVRTSEKPKTPLMNQTVWFGYTETDDFQALELPYVGEELAMLVLLPKKDDLARLEKKLTADLLASVAGKLKLQEVDVTLPRFKTTAQFELADVLAKMGMPLGPFSGMAQKSLAISNVIHKAFVDVNEEGTEAAAATAVGAIPSGGRPSSARRIPVFRADHPFVYLIRDTRSGSVLFLGRLADPSKSAN